MRVSEWLEGQPNLFAELLSVDASLTFIEEFTPETIQMFYEVLFSDRIVSRKMEKKTTKELAKILSVMYGQSWTKVLYEFNKRYKVGTDLTRTINNQTTTQSTGEMSTDVVDKTSPFNTPSNFVDTGKTQDVANNQSNVTSDNTTIDSMETLDAVVRYRDMFQDLVLTNIIFKDINSLLTISIHTTGDVGSYSVSIGGGGGGAGSQGPQGPKGPKGDPGTQGEPGPQGPKGDIPIIYSATPPVDTDIMWVDETEEVPAKANKQQEDWITPTLLNGWTDFGGIYETIGYMKDEFGFVHMKGMVKDGSVGAILFTLPEGYRPLKNQYHPCFSRDVLRTLTIRGNGDVFIPAVASNVWLTLNGISFKAEA